jgi:GR25 family glycosyltransferase involved in LPS biosynthesis
MKVYLINLDRRPDRLAEMTERLGALGLEFERVSAFDGKNQSVVRLVSWVKAYIYNDMVLPTRGQIGVYHSHRKIWQKMLDEGTEQALVFEDDAVPVDWNSEILKIKLLDLDLDQLRLEAHSAKLFSQTDRVENAPTKVLDRVAIDEPSYGTAAYLITNQGARKSLAVGKFWFNVDHFDIWSSVAGLRTAVIRPVMWKQSESPSDIAIPVIPRGRPSTFKRAFDFSREMLWRARRPIVRPLKKNIRTALLKRTAQVKGFTH